MSEHSTTKRSGPAVPEGAPQFRLAASAEAGGTAYESEAVITLLGSRRDCHLPLTHPDISKVHCALVNTGREIVVRDLHSRGGTSLNDRPIQRAMMRPGDKLRVGPCVIDVEFTQPPGRARGKQDAMHSATPLVLTHGGQIFTLHDNCSLIGRREGVEVQIDTPDVSLAHALLVFIGGQPAVADLGSRSGTLVNGERIELAWLSNGDELTIGGEKLIVQWDSAQQAAAEEAAGASLPDLPLPDEICEEPPISAEDLSDLEQMIGALQDQVVGARTLLDEQRLELQQQQALLAEEQTKFAEERAALEQLRNELEQREQVVSEERGGLQQAMEQLAAERQQLQQQSAELEERRQHIDERVADLAAQASELEGRLKALEQEQAALLQAQEEQRQLHERIAAERAALEQQTAALAEQNAVLAQQQEELGRQRAAWDEERQRSDGELVKREEEVAKRETLISQREQQEAHSAQRIEQFKAALSRASEMLSSMSSPEQAQAVQKELQKAVRPARARSAGGKKGGAGKSGEAEEESDEPLPAPMVAQPMFGAGSGTPPEDWPQELRERFLTLRRVSNKPDQDLLQQVWAERDKVMGQDDARRKKRRFLWGS